MNDRTHYLELAAAFSRGVLGLDRATPALEAVERVERAGLRLGKFKRNAELPRVRRALGVLMGFAPTRVLDIGSGRGTFLFPLLDEMPGAEVLALELACQRSRDLGAMARGGVDHLQPLRGDVTAIPVVDRSVEVVTILEVLEHLERPEAAAAEVIRAARRAVIASVPSKPDTNPQHIQLLTAPTLQRLLLDAGARRVTVDAVRGHLIAVATTEPLRP